MQNRFHGFVALVVSMLMHVVVHISCGFYYETGSMTYLKNVVAGTFTSTPQIIPRAFGAHTGFSDLYIWLYQHCPGWEWHDIFMLGFSVAGLALLIMALYAAIRHSLSERKSNTTIFVWALIASVAFYADNLLQTELTRSSITIAFSAFFLLVFEARKWWHYLLLNVILVSATLIRTEVFGFSVMLILPAVLAGAGLKRLVYCLTPTLILYVVFLVAINAGLTAEERAYLAFRPYQFILLDYEIKKEVPFESPQDSMAILLAKNGFWCDEGVIDEKLFRKYYLPLDKIPSNFFNYLKAVDWKPHTLIKKAMRVSTRYYILLLLPLLLLSLQTIAKSRGPWLSLPLVLYYAVLLAGLLVFIKIEDRVLYPALIAFLVLSLRICSACFLQLYLLVAIVVCCIIAGFGYKQMQETRDIDDYMRRLEKTLEKQPAGSVAVYDLKAVTDYGLKLSLKRQSPAIKKASIDNGLLHLNTQLQKDNLQTFGNDKCADMIAGTATDSSFVWVSCEGRMKLILAYMRIVHGLSMHYVVLDNFGAVKNENVYPRIMRLYLDN
ncbi:MAG: hypothetical protein U0V74_12160 [Chitinophagales bacterium]